MSWFGWPRKKLRNVWGLAKGSERGILVGTAHFSPFSFKKPLTELVNRGETIIFEGPLDKESMARVAAYGQLGDGTPSVYEALSPEARKELNDQLAMILDGGRTSDSCLDLFPVSRPDYVKNFAEGVKPWLAFFSIWSTLLNWQHSMDVEAYEIALSRGKPITYLETIDDQLCALDGIPFERIVAFLEKSHLWNTYRRQYREIFLSGDRQSFAAMLSYFPTRCDSILTIRDPIFFAGIKKAMAQNATTAFVGNAHIIGLYDLFAADGYQITQMSV
jgi:uncharacterized protein YbaP (TraB family)